MFHRVYFVKFRCFLQRHQTLDTLSFEFKVYIRYLVQLCPPALFLQLRWHFFLSCQPLPVSKNINELFICNKYEVEELMKEGTTQIEGAQEGKCKILLINCRSTLKKSVLNFLVKFTNSYYFGSIRRTGINRLLYFKYCNSIKSVVLKTYHR